MPWLASILPFTYTFMLALPLVVPLFSAVAVTVTVSPGVTLDVERVAFWTWILDSATGWEGGATDTVDECEVGAEDNLPDLVAACLVTGPPGSTMTPLATPSASPGRHP